MYKELLDIVRNSDQPDDTSTSTDVTNRAYAANLPVVLEESETEFPSFSMKKRGDARPNLKRGDSEFDEVIDQVLEENKQGFRRDDLSDDDDDELAPDRLSGNPLKDFTFVGGNFTMAPKVQREDPKKLDSITAIRDYLETELGQERLYQAYPILRDFGDDILYEEKTAELIEKLEFVMSEPEVIKYRNFFALLVFHDTTVD